MSSSNLPVSIKEASDMGTEKLRSLGVDSPGTACELLLMHVLKCQRIDLYLNFGQPLTSSQLKCFDELLDQRVKGKPIQYIIKSANFFGLDLYVDENVLIPRPETEILVEAVITRLVDLNQKSTIIDWGTGSGNIAIALASHLDCEIYAMDISPEALEIATRNVARHNLQNKIKSILGEGFSALTKDLFGKADAVAANPPYVRPEELESLPREVKDYEPKQALFDREDGLFFSRQIVRDAKDYLKPKGLLALEVALGQANKVSSLIEWDKHYKNIEIVADLAGIERVVLARRK